MMKTVKLIASLVLLAFAPVLASAQLTINIRYTGENGNARKYVEEMESSGIAAKIRAIEGCIRYDYFFPNDDPEGVLLIDEWEGQQALNRYHSSPVMQEAANLREKYSLGGRQVRMFNPAAPGAPAGPWPQAPSAPAPRVQTVDFSVWPQGEPNSAYAKYFTGNSYLAPMEGGVSNVTFEPGCRNNWHIHHKQVQVIVCVAGRGWYQEWGKAPVLMTPGKIIAVPAGTKHWHGAAKDSWFQHLTYFKDMKKGARNEWLEAVTGEVYNALQ